jgi:hypothetical protein
VVVEAAGLADGAHYARSSRVGGWRLALAGASTGTPVAAYPAADIEDTVAGGP